MMMMKWLVRLVVGGEETSITMCSASEQRRRRRRPLLAQQNAVAEIDQVQAELAKASQQLAVIGHIVQPRVRLCVLLSVVVVIVVVFSGSVVRFEFRVSNFAKSSKFRSGQS